MMSNMNYQIYCFSYFSINPVDKATVLIRTKRADNELHLSFSVVSLIKIFILNK